MSITSLNPRNLARRAGAASESRTAKVLDWATAFAFAAWASYRMAVEWPEPTGWTVAAAAMAVAGFALAWFQWIPKLQARVRSRMFTGFVRKRS